MAIAGRVAIVPKGDWSADATYKRLDAVTYNNTLYFAKKEVPVGTATSNTEYWSKSIVGGASAIATTEDAGVVKPDGKSMSVDESGTLSINLDGTTITLDEAKNVIKLADTLKDKIGSALQPESIVNNQVTTETGYALDARQANPNLDGTLAKQVADLNGSLGNLKVLTCASFEALDAELSNMSTNTPYIAVIPGGDGMLFGLKNHSDYQRQIRITYWDNALYSRVKTNSTQWSEWVKLNDIKSSHEIKLDTGIYFGYFGYAGSLRFSDATITNGQKIQLPSGITDILGTGFVITKGSNNIYVISVGDSNIQIRDNNWNTVQSLKNIRGGLTVNVVY